MILVSMSLIMLAGTVVAQSHQEEQKTHQNAAEKNGHFMMKDGKMIKPDGSYQLKNGK